MRMGKTRAIAAALALTLFATPASFALADDAETQELETQLEDLQKRAEEQQRKTDKLDERIGTVSEQLRVLSEDVKEAETEYREIAGELAATEMRIEENEELLAETEAKLSDKVAQLRGRIRNIYMHGQVNYIDVLFGAKDFSDFLTRMDLFKRVIASDTELVREVQAEKRVVEETRAALEKQRAYEARLAKAAEEKHEELLDRQADKNRLLARMESDREVSQQAYEELIAASAEVERLIRASRYQYPGGGTGAMIWPLVGEITSPYGWRTHPIYGDSRYHSGMDIGGDYGDPILAAAAGVVTYSGWISGYGYAVIIDHGGGISTLYGHNEALAVSEGQTVAQGQIIAYCGSTGNSTGPHCHFEVREGGEPVDPMGYL
ncbi:MAG: peptidoglycan DD-metalloendopeptidase family protein [Selenomonadaceae bacterium]|nr:peptidoglycan DD-metalloendopeptidase family protein [Selenomonadaceae bacterium]